jgi:LysR family transcriptional regulator, nitrogen assimilation regulatory protein
MDLDKLKLVIEVAEAGSLSRVAASRGTPQSVISRQIATMERDLGARLFHRTGRGVTLTELADRVLPDIRSLLVAGDQLLTQIRGTANEPVGDVRLGMLTSMVQPLARCLFQKARSQFPRVRLHLYEGTGGQLEEWLSGGKLDIALLFGRGRARAPDAMPLGRAAMHLIGPLGDALTRAPTVHFNKLHRLPLALPGPSSGVQSLLEQIARRKKISIFVAMVADSHTIQKEVVVDGGLYAVLASYAAFREVKEKRLQSARIIEPTVVRPVVLLTSKQHPVSLASRSMAALIKQVSGSFPWDR